MIEVISPSSPQLGQTPSKAQHSHIDIHPVFDHSREDRACGSKGLPLPEKLPLELDTVILIRRTESMSVRCPLHDTPCPARTRDPFSAFRPGAGASPHPDSFRGSNGNPERTSVLATTTAPRIPSTTDGGSLWSTPKDALTIDVGSVGLPNRCRPCRVQARYGWVTPPKLPTRYRARNAVVLTGVSESPTTAVATANSREYRGPGPSTLPPSRQPRFSSLATAKPLQGP